MSSPGLRRAPLQRAPFQRQAAAALIPLAAILSFLPLEGCHHGTRLARSTPPPPIANRGSSRATPELAAGNGFFDDTRAKPTFSETGLATWYYAHGHTGADGQRYDASAPTAAHKTLPIGSTVRVTNMQTGQATFVRITDRGPFYPGRILDLSEIAAKQIGLYRAGIAEVRIEAYPHPQADPLGRWCVQTGPFTAVNDALDLKATLLDRYHGARVSEFTGQTGFWVRIDPVTRGRSEATAVADWIGAPDRNINSYVVRIN